MKPRAGFTILELVIVLIVGGILTAITVRSFGSVWAPMGVRAAHSAFFSMHAQTRAVAIERGQLTRLVVDPSDGTVSVIAMPAGGSPDTVGTRDFLDAYNVTLRTDPAGSVVLCMTPRGYASPACNSFSTSATVIFVAGDRQMEVELLPMGQVR